MATRSLAREEKYALPVAVGFHVLLVIALLWQPVGDAIVQPPERVTVTLSEDVGFTSTAPDPVPDAAPPAAMSEPLPPSEAAPVEPRQDTPVTRPDARQPAKRSEPAREQPARTPAKTPAKAAARTAESKIGEDFLGGRGANEASQNTGTAAAEIGPRVRSSLASSISRQLKPHWSAPQGADAEQLVTILAWDMNRDGSLSGNPRVVRQTGVTDANRAQAGRHAEQAIRAVRLAAPFNLPEEYYDAWKRVSDFRFDRKL